VKILISCIVIDDDKNTTKVFTDILMLMGLEVVAQGYNGNDAVSLYKKFRPDIAFIDIVMPQTDGFYALEKIREFDPDAKVVAVTAECNTETVQRLDEMKVSAIICKPFDKNEIKQVLFEKYKMNV
jgi:DNA-binding NarL/FixJ family response regulator